MILKDMLRTLVGIRKERQLLPATEKPQIGSNIVRENLRIRLKYPITDDQWEWLIDIGWRTIDMRKNRRRYINVPDKAVIRLLEAGEVEREVLHMRLVRFGRNGSHSEKPANAEDAMVKPTHPGRA